MFSNRTFLAPLLVLLIFGLAACTGPMAAEDDADEDAADDPAEEAINWAAEEDFDPSPYRDEPPVLDVQLEHDVPQPLMDGHADAGTTQQVEGFRIQVFTSNERSAAEEMRQELMQWWEEHRDEAPAGIFGEELPVYITHRTPYYRVRIGNYPSRDHAQEALAFVERHFGDAFLTPATVTITR